MIRWNNFFLISYEGYDDLHLICERTNLEIILFLLQKSVWANFLPSKKNVLNSCESSPVADEETIYLKLPSFSDNLLSIKLHFVKCVTNDSFLFKITSASSTTINYGLTFSSVSNLSQRIRFSIDGVVISISVVFQLTAFDTLLLMSWLIRSSSCYSFFLH